MDAYDPEEEPDSSEEVDPIEEVVEGDNVPRAQFEKVQREARSLRTKLRRTEFAAEFGADVVELVPETLPIKEQRDLAAKLRERLGLAAPTLTDEGTEPPAEPAAAQPTEQERRAAALAREGTRGTASGSISHDEWLAMAGTDPSAAQAALRAGRVNLAGLREGLGPDR